MFLAGISSNSKESSDCVTLLQHSLPLSKKTQSSTDACCLQLKQSQATKPFPGSDELKGTFCWLRCDEGHDFDVNCVLAACASESQHRGSQGCQPNDLLGGCLSQVFH